MSHRIIIEVNGYWEVVTNLTYRTVRVRWSLPDERGRYLWVRIDPLNAAGYKRCWEEADRLNSQRVLPADVGGYCSYKGAVPLSLGRKWNWPSLKRSQKVTAAIYPASFNCRCSLTPVEQLYRENMMDAYHRGSESILIVHSDLEVVDKSTDIFATNSSVQNEYRKNA